MKTIVRNIPVLIICLLILSSLSSINIKSISSNSSSSSFSEIIVPYSFEELKIEEVAMDGGTFSRVKMGEELGSGEIGEPVLPVKGCYILLPYGCDFESVQVTVRNEQSMTLDHMVEPGQQFYPYNYEGEIEFISPDVDVYSSNSLFPGKSYDVVSVQHVRGYNVLILRLYPVRYNPSENKIVYASSIEVKINSHRVDFDDIDVVHENFRGLQKDIDKIGDMVDNPETVNFYPGPFPTHTYEYVIITTEDLKNYDDTYNFQALRDMRISNGLNAKIVTLEEIIQDYPGSDTQQKIRNFIRYAYNNWDTEYVLLGGDDDVIPSRKLYQIFWMYESYMPSDLYYACLDGPYDNDGDGRWGEFNDGENGGDVDLFAEVYVGRACVGNGQEISNFVKKTIEYTDAPVSDDYLEKALWVGEHLGFGGVAEYAKDMKEQNIGYCISDGYTTNGLPEGEEGYTVDRLYEKDAYWTKSDLMNKLNDNVHLINHLGHGNVKYAMKMYNSDVDDLTNDKYFFVYSQTCLAGHFDNADCFAEEITVKSPHGAFAAVMNARFGWGRGSSTDGPSQRYDREFWDALYGENKARLGEANHDSKEDNAYRINEVLMRWCYYETNLFGDPALHIKGAGPILRFSPPSHNFGKMLKGQTDSTTFEIWNSGPETLYYSVSTDVSWLSVLPDSGSSTGEHDTVTVSIDTTGMANGEHKADIIINSNAGSDEFHVVVMVGPVLGFSPTSHDFGQMEEGETDSTSFDIWNRGLQTLDYSVSTDVSWLSILPGSGSSTGEHDTVTVSIDTTGMANGLYNANMYIDTNAEDDVFNVKVKVGSVLDFDPSFYDFGNVGTGNTVSTTFEIWNDGTGTLIYSISESCDWVEVFPESGSSTGEHDTVTVTIDTKDLSFAGHHSCDILINSNGGTDIFSITVDAIAFFYSTPNDGTIYATDICGDPWESGYYEVRNSPTGTVDGNSDTLTVGQWVEYTGVGHHEWTWKMYRSFLFFDTSEISNLPEGYEITDAWISLYPVNGQARYVFDIIIRNGQPVYPHDSLQSSDYDISKYYEEVGRFHPTEDNVNFYGYNNITFNEEGLQSINENGISKFCLMSSMDWDNEAIYSKNWVSAFSNEGNYKPILNIKVGYPNQNQPPANSSDPNPYNGEQEVELTPTLSCMVEDPDKFDVLDVSFYLNGDLIGIDEDVTNGMMASYEIQTLLAPETAYSWYVVVDDGEDFTTSDTWYFTTRTDPTINHAPNKPNNPIPFNGATNVDISPTFIVEVYDTDNDILDVSFYLNDVLIGTDHDVASGDIATIDLGYTLDYGVTYNWYAVADDGEHTNTSDIWEFTTLEDPSVNHPPYKPLIPNPFNGENDVSLNPTISIYVYDSDGDTLDITFYNEDDDSIIGIDTEVSSGNRASVIWNDLDYDTTYRWYAVADDGEYTNTSDIWEFTTEEDQSHENVKINIMKPLPYKIYYKNQESIPFLFTIVIGEIEIKINLTDPDERVNEIRFLINDELKSTNNPNNLTWNWDERVFGFKTIKVAAFDEEDELASDELKVFIFNLNLFQR